MNTFDQAIETAEARQAAPVTEAKAALAPARAELVRQARDFATAVAAANPIIVEAQEKQQAAGGVGIRHPELSRHLQALCGDGVLPGLLHSVPATFEGSIQAIDRLSPRDLGMDPYAVTRLAGAPGSSKSLIGALQKLTETVRRDLVELEAIVRNAGPAGQMLTRDPAPRPASPVVETEFAV